MCLERLAEHLPLDVGEIAVEVACHGGQQVAGRRRFLGNHRAPIGGELQVAAPYLMHDQACGHHELSIPPLPELRGQELFIQAARIGAEGVQLLNALRVRVDD